MKLTILRVLSALPGLLMLSNGLGFVFVPADMAASLGMELLDGIGRSTQIGDFGSFFLSCAAFIFFGAARAAPSGLIAGGTLLGLAAVMRVVAWAAHGAALATPIIIAELVMTLWLFGFAFAIYRAKASAAA